MVESPGNIRMNNSILSLIEGYKLSWFSNTFAPFVKGCGYVIPKLGKFYQSILT